MTEETFQTGLRDLLGEAHDSGIEVRGAWPILNDDPEVPDWDLEIVVLSDRDRL